MTRHTVGTKRDLVQAGDDIVRALQDVEAHRVQEHVVVGVGKDLRLAAVIRHGHHVVPELVPGLLPHRKAAVLHAPRHRAQPVVRREGAADDVVVVLHDAAVDATVLPKVVGHIAAVERHLASGRRVAGRAVADDAAAPERDVEPGAAAVRDASRHDAVLDGVAVRRTPDRAAAEAVLVHLVRPVGAPAAKRETFHLRFPVQIHAPHGVES